MPDGREVIVVAHQLIEGRPRPQQCGQPFFIFCDQKRKSLLCKLDKMNDSAFMASSEVCNGSEVMALDQELATYLQNLQNWIEAGKEGRWVVIHGADVLGFFDTLDAAAAAGYEQLGLSELFMVKQVSRQHAPIHASRRAVYAHHQQDD